MLQITRSSILVTKIEPPPVAAGLLERPRLLALLPLIRAKQLTLIKAAAGFGKTSAGAAWAERLAEADSRVAWLGLDRDDDVPTRFLYYVGHALQRTHAGIGTSMNAMIAEISLLPIETAISVLINELAELDEDVFLFLDDYHNITEPAIHEGLTFLLRRASANFHLILISRSDPPLPLVRWRAQNTLLEVDASSLRFDLTETRRFLEREKIDWLNAEQMSMLHSTTDGWPAVLRLVASRQHGDGLDAYLRSMRGVSRPIEAYIDDMLAALPMDMVLFMMRTSILDRFSASLCDAVTMTQSSRHWLDAIAKRQLLMTPLGSNEQWYQYHPLLAESLRQRLAAQHGDEVPGLHRYAASWLASRELWTLAVEHALAAGDTAQALSWIENCAMAMVKRGELLTLLAWQRQFPDDVMRGQLTVRLAIAWGMALAMRFDESLALLTDIERDSANGAAPPQDDIAGECRTIRSVDVALRDDTTAALALAEPCVRSDGANRWNINVASNVVRIGLWKRGDLKGFYAVPWLPYPGDDDHRNVLSHVYRLCLQGLVELQQLRFDVAERHFVEALRRGEQQVGSQSTCAALPAALIGLVRFEQDRLDEAEAMIGDRLSTISATTMLECVLPAYVVLARVAAIRSNVERAYALLEQGGNLGQLRRWGRLIAAMQVERLKLYISEERHTEAAACLLQLDRLVAEYPAPERCAWSEIATYGNLARAHVALAQRSWPEAIAILQALHVEVLSAQRLYFGVHVETLLCLALFEAGEKVEATERLRRVLTGAAPAGIYRTILDSGPGVGAMLLRIRESAERQAEWRKLLPYMDHLLDGWRARYEPGSTRNDVIADPLSQRERGILVLIADGRSNKEIAKSLGITPETVKSHVKNIFVKLSVEKRAQAIARAQSIGLLRTGTQ
jgi:LuxR family maltose regulon positive regulatory protein